MQHPPPPPLYCFIIIIKHIIIIIGFNSKLYLVLALQTSALCYGRWPILYYAIRSDKLSQLAANTFRKRSISYNGRESPFYKVGIVSHFMDGCTAYASYVLYLIMPQAEYRKWYCFWIYKLVRQNGISITC